MDGQGKQELGGGCRKKRTAPAEGLAGERQQWPADGGGQPGEDHEYADGAAGIASLAFDDGGEGRDCQRERAAGTEDQPGDRIGEKAGGDRKHGKA